MAIVRVLQCIGIHPTKLGLLVSHNPSTVPMVVCPYGAIRLKYVATPPLPALTSEASGIDDLGTESSSKTRLTYSALAALSCVASLASGCLDDTMRP
jgi:hypothetical protein